MPDIALDTALLTLQAQNVVNFTRVTSVGAMLEYAEEIDNTRVTAVDLQVEYVEALDDTRITSVSIMVEYVPAEVEFPVQVFWM